jgi:hypothetical protein
MLDTVKVAELAAQAARKWIELERVIVEPMVDSQGDEALRVTLVLDPKVVDGVSGDDVLDVLVDINEALQSAGDERLPIIYYATEEDLHAGAYS